MLVLDRTAELLDKVAGVKTLDGDIPVYDKARVEIMQFNPADLHPTAKYILSDHLQFVINLRRKLSLELFSLDYLYQDDLYLIAPPIVEFMDGVPAIVDGLHRCSLALMLGMQITAIFVVGANPEIPFISYPVTWIDVVEYQHKPETPYLLRSLRKGIADESSILRKHYRDFSALGSFGRRPRSVQDG